jgi:hypothetical protein
MKNIFILALLMVTVFFSIPQGVNATVGGPTFIHSFKYNPANESVYYIRVSEGGKGCPPALMKISLNTGKVETVFSCSDGEKLITNENYNTNPAVNEINKIIKDFKPLTQLNLKENKISIDVNFINSEKYSSELPEILRSNFTGLVYQNEKKVNEIPITGCGKGQPFTFAGYAIPGFEKKIMLLLSTKGNCFEGGYTGESLYVIGGVNDLNKKYYTNYIKSTSELAPSDGTLTIYEGDKVVSVIGTTTTDATNQNLIKTLTEMVQQLIMQLQVLLNYRK